MTGAGEGWPRLGPRALGLPGSTWEACCLDPWGPSPLRGLVTHPISLHPQEGLIVPFAGRYSWVHGGWSVGRALFVGVISQQAGLGFPDGTLEPRLEAGFWLGPEGCQGGVGGHRAGVLS